MVIPFEQCIARPETDGKEFPLTDHLEAVAWKMGIILVIPHLS